MSLSGAYAIAALLWAASVIAAPAVEAAASGGHALNTAAHLVYVVGAVVCHQQQERSFTHAGLQLPVCARCTGIYIAAAIVAVALALTRWRSRPASLSRSFSGLRRQQRLAVAALAALPTLATLVYEWTTGDMPSNVTRFAAGVPLGALVSWIMATAAGRSTSAGAL